MELAIVYMVAGMSSRFGGEIKQFAKIGSNGETLMEISMNQAIKAGCTRIIFIVGEKTEIPFKQMFGDIYKQTPVFYAKQTFDANLRDKPWGTADALCCAKEVINCPFVVCNGDDIYGENTFRLLFEHLSKENHQNNRVCVTAGFKLVQTLPDNYKGNRAIFKLDENFNVLDLQERFNLEKNKLFELGLKEEDLCSMNCFGLYPEVVVKLNEILIQFKGKNKDDRKIECLLPEQISNLVKQNHITLRLYKTEDKCFGVTSPDDVELVKQQLSVLSH